VTHPTRARELWLSFQGNPDETYRNPVIRIKYVNGVWQTTKLNVVSGEYIGFGKGLTGGPPAIFLFGRVGADTQDTLYRSDDDGATWVRLNNPATYKFPGMTTLSGDMRNRNRVFVGFGGRGVMVGEAIPTSTIQYNFETGVQTWYVGWTNGAVTASVGTSTAQKYEGVQSLSVGVNSTAPTGTLTQVAVRAASPSSTAVGKTVTFRYWLPVGHKVQSVIAFSQDNVWGWNGAYFTPGAGGGWQTATITVPTNSAVPLNAIGLAFDINGTWNSTIHVDAVSW
jgi:hypothetical protein